MSQSSQRSHSSQRSPGVSERFYAALLWLYPTSFRHEYGCEMVQTFRDLYRQERAASAVGGVLRLWGLMLSDLLTTLCIEHYRALFGREKEFLMTNAFLHLDVAYKTDIGLKRSGNEDHASSYVPEDEQELTRKGALFVVADGMGGHAYGDVASEMAVNVLHETYYQDAETDVATSLQRAVELANAQIFATNKGFQQDQSAVKQNFMGTTIVAVVIKDDHAFIANVGDSLVYLVRGEQVIQLAQNHAWVAEQVVKGLLTPEQARTHEKKNVITRCLGTKESVEVYCASEKVQDGDILVLCTDGLYSLVPEPEIRSLVQRYDSQESAQRLIARANEQGGVDNITALVVHVALSSAK